VVGPETLFLSCLLTNLLMLCYLQPVLWWHRSTLWWWRGLRQREESSWTDGQTAQEWWDPALLKAPPQHHPPELWEKGRCAVTLPGGSCTCSVYDRDTDHVTYHKDISCQWLPLQVTKDATILGRRQATSCLSESICA